MSSPTLAQPLSRDVLAYRAYQRTYHQRRRARLLAAGLCPDCGCSRDSRFKRCAYCRAGTLIRAERSQFRQKAGLR